MNKKLAKNVISFLMLVVLLVPVTVMAQDYFPEDEVNLPGQTADDVDLVGTVVNLINVVLGVLGLIAVIIILIGGFKWMTAQGNDDRVEEAQKTIRYGIIGLVVILLAYVIVRVVISAAFGFGNDPSGFEL